MAKVCVYDILTKAPGMRPLERLSKPNLDNLRRISTIDIRAGLIEDPVFENRTQKLGDKVLFGGSGLKPGLEAFLDIVPPELEIRRITRAVHIASFSPDPVKYLEGLQNIAKDRQRFRRLIEEAKFYALGTVPLEPFRGKRIGEELVGRKIGKEEAAMIAREVIEMGKNGSYEHQDIVEVLLLEDRNEHLIGFECGIVTDEQGRIERVLQKNWDTRLAVVTTENPENTQLGDSLIINPEAGMVERILAIRFLEGVTGDRKLAEVAVPVTKTMLEFIRKNPMRKKMKPREVDSLEEAGDKVVEAIKLIADTVADIESLAMKATGLTIREIIEPMIDWERNIRAKTSN
ncbi:hypothetical protein HY990_00445 [Candidatus Micrarchaeota archaeon]|nr:hypothetical protein [Candidatus Micrarchaeota archaeon]